MVSVTVVIPTYNRANLLRRAVDSVVAQTFRDLELIIVDDGSSDGTGEAVQAFRDPRVVFLRHSTNRGAPAARNTGIRHARGRYVAFLDADDEWLPRKLEVQLQLFRETDLPRLGLVTSYAFSAYEGRRKVLAPSSRRPRRGWLFEELLQRRPVIPWATSGLLVRQEALDESTMFDESLPAAQDWDFVLRISQRWQIDCTQEPLYIRHFHGGPSITEERGTAHIVAAERILEKYFPLMEKRPRVLARTYYGLARRYYRAGELARSRNYALRALKQDKRMLRAAMLSLLTLVPIVPLPKLYGALPVLRSRLRWIKY